MRVGSVQACHLDLLLLVPWKRGLPERGTDRITDITPDRNSRAKTHADSDITPDKDSQAKTHADSDIGDSDTGSNAKRRADSKPHGRTSRDADLGPLVDHDSIGDRHNNTRANCDFDADRDTRIDSSANRRGLSRRHTGGNGGGDADLDPRSERNSNANRFRIECSADCGNSGLDSADLDRWFGVFPVGSRRELRAGRMAGRSRRRL